MIPGSEEHFLARSGKVTASRAHDILPGKSGKYLKSRHNYMIEKYIELRTGEPFEKFQGNTHTEQGKYLEPFAVAAYEAQTDYFVEPCALVLHPAISYLQASPDGLVNDDGCIEVKARVTGNTLFDHFECISQDKMPDKHIAQVQTVMLCADRRWCDFISYCAQMPDDEKLFVKRIHRDPDYCAMIESEVAAFWVEVMALVERIKAA